MPISELTFHEHVSRSTGSGTVHKFRTEDGKYFDTWDADLATQVKQHLTQPVQVEWDEVPGKNGYTNYKIRRMVAGNSSPATQGAAAGEPVSEQKPPAAPGPSKPSQDYWNEKDMRITRSFGVNAALQALNIAGGDKAAAQQLLMDATELAPIAAVYAWKGK